MALRVAVIGAGAAGLCVLRHLSACPDVFSPVVYEMCDELGGTWVYTHQVGVDDKGIPIHTSMYTNLKTNLPKETMAFLDFPFSEDLPSFLGHTDVQNYIQEYVEQFELTPYIKFQTRVMNVAPDTTDDGSVKWRVTTRCHLTCPPTDSTSVFDALIVCNGHYSEPVVPHIPGQSDFKGQVLHSHDYRDPAEFKGKVVFCLGGGMSGQDIALDLLPHANKVYLCYRDEQHTPSLPPCLEQTSGLSRLHSHSVELEGGKVLEVDTLLLCTGYHYTFPFLSPECGVSVSEDERVTPLWKHLIHTRFPSMSFIGLPKLVTPFPLFDIQAQFVTRVLAGEVSLPSQTEMELDQKADYEERLASGMPPKAAHHLMDKQWKYYDDLAELGGFKSVPLLVEKLFNYVISEKMKDTTAFKNMNFTILGKDTFIATPL